MLRLASETDNRPTLYIRRPGSDAEEIHQFHDDDPFLTEMSNFTDALITEGELDLGRPTSASPQILSSYEDGKLQHEKACLSRGKHR